MYFLVFHPSTHQFHLFICPSTCPYMYNIHPYIHPFPSTDISINQPLHQCLSFHPIIDMSTHPSIFPPICSIYSAEHSRHYPAGHETIAVTTGGRSADLSGGGRYPLYLTVKRGFTHGYNSSTAITGLAIILGGKVRHVKIIYLFYSIILPLF